ncbi:MAG: AMP-binding protein [Xanthomonadales bacterium]|nr:AMP-binding protein [Gammaproteobacteria bacterium]MBT8052735.1 AMP-binding protein [Gammaproteobacteria bacterium]NND55909.1 AMP-binding protein [Xanthomonadales bacterium]NNK50607.1 AMP-binding protein [Xanthomonadales bacterium]
MVNQPWLDSYPEGVPAEIDLSGYSSILDIFSESVEKFGNQTAYVNFDKELTYRDLDRLTRNFAAWLQSKGLEKGDRIALMMPNILQYPVAIFGAMRAGLVIVNTNPMYTARELRHQLQDSGARAIVVVENFAHVLEKIRGEVEVEQVITTQIGDMLGFPKGLMINFALKYVKKQIPAFNLPGSTGFNEALSQGAKAELKPVEFELDDIAFLQYTGGTTGVAKGAMLTHRNLVANMLQSKAWMIPAGIGQDTETVITALPLYHIFALTANCLVYMAMGGVNVLITDPRNMTGFINELKKVPFTFIPGVNTLFNGLLNEPEFAKLDFSTLKGALGGGMAVQRAVAEKWKEVTGTPLIEAYGLTETSPAACINPMDIEGFNGCIGLPISSTECAIMNDQEDLLEQGEVGELVIRGPQVMKGYWQRPEETGKVMTDEGWLRTGDIALMTEDGFFKIVDRKKDMILVSGFNVFPNEIEDVVALHPKVLEVAVIGVPDAKSTEAVKVFVVKSDPSLTEEEIRAHCKDQLTGYKRPRHVEFRDELPKSNVGKILRRELRDEELAKQA